jgi:DNA-binding transcriptional regulator YiaG
VKKKKQGKNRAEKTARERRDGPNFDSLAVREGLAMTQEAFARLIGVSVQTVRRWEYGQCRPSGLALAKIEQVLAERKGGAALFCQ